jgi:glycosyltransferase involved in cell wall biosynthesis
MNTEVSLIISFYNKLEPLLLILESLRFQTMKKFEVLIADDGSDKEVVNKLILLSGTYPFPIRHIWHPDEGWRKNAIINKAIATSSSDYLIFIDGDCIPEKHFIEEHFLNRQTGAALSGRRVNMSASATESLSPESIRNHKLGFFFLVRLFAEKIFLGRGTHIENAIFIRSSFIRKRIYKENKGILGCNFSMYKSDLLSINGFDERYQSAFVGEDSDLEMRFLNRGGKTISVKHKAIVFHCYHKRMENDKRNMVIYNQSLKEGLSFTPYGIIKENSETGAQ